MENMNMNELRSLARERNLRGYSRLTLFQPGGGIHPPPGFSLAIATKINRSTPNFLTFNFYYRDII